MPTLPRSLLERKTLLMSVVLIARWIEKALDLGPGAGASELSRRLRASRTSAYEQAQRVLWALEKLATAGPGRPPKTAEPAGERPSTLELTLAVLRYRLEHPGSWIVGRSSRVTYSSPLRRFVLQLRNSWEGTLMAFAEAVEIPLDTLRDWIARDGIEELQEEAKEPLLVPVDASEMVQTIAEHWQRWEGSLRSFLIHGHKDLGISRDQLARVMRILGTIRRRRTRREHRYRGSTRRLAPGMVLVTDGKELEVQLIGSGRAVKFNWQGIVDQTTGCDTAVVVSAEEDAASARTAYDASLETLHGVVPDALLHDRKPCYEEAELVDHLAQCGTESLPATAGRPENKAILEGSFGLWEQRMGILVLDDSSTDNLIASAVSEALRAYTAATNGVPREELGGKSRLSALRTEVPTAEQRERDLAYLRQLVAAHKRSRSVGRRGGYRAPDPTCLALLDAAFERHGLVNNDPRGRLRRYLASFSAAAVRRGLAVLAARFERLEQRTAHRYLARVIQSQEEELELERAAAELERLCQQAKQHWNEAEEEELSRLREQRPDVADLAVALAEKAAQASIPLGGRFWTRQLLALLAEHRQLLDRVRRHLIRLYEESVHQRLALLDTLTAWSHDLMPMPQPRAAR